MPSNTEYSNDPLVAKVDPPAGEKKRSLVTPPVTAVVSLPILKISLSFTLTNRLLFLMHGRIAL